MICQNCGIDVEKNIFCKCDEDSNLNKELIDKVLAAKGIYYPRDYDLSKVQEEC
jgi:hypothetical protein